MERVLNVDLDFCAPYFIALLMRQGYFKDD